MFRVSDFMTKDVITTEKDATISEIVDLMKEKKIHRVPVVEKDQLVGLITEGMISNTNGQATSLSIYELNYLLSKTKVSTVMAKDVYCVHDTDLMEAATELMLEKDIGCLPVLNDEEKIVGILTTNDILKSYLDFVGRKDEGMRVTIRVKDAVGVATEISKVFSDRDINITHLGVFATDNDYADMVIRCSSTDPAALKKALEDKGYIVLEMDA